MLEEQTMSPVDPVFLLTLYPGRQWSLPGEGYIDDVKWLDGDAPATLASDWGQWGNRQEWLTYQQTARVALEASDVTVLRCIENGVAVPAEWASFRKALRAILSTQTGDATQPPPSRPAYPAGT